MLIQEQLEINGKFYPHLREETPEEKAQRKQEEEARKPEEIQYKIQALKEKLQETDYVVIKISEGVSETSDYSEIIEERKTYRKEINDLEEELKNLLG